MRLLYHLSMTEPTMGPEGFIHCSFADAVTGSAELYFPGASPRVYTIDPLRLAAPVRIADTPRGPMPHVHGPIDADAIRHVGFLDEPRVDRRTGGRFAFVAFPEMTLLDLVGIYDPIARIRTMGFDGESRCAIIGTKSAGWAADGAALVVDAIRPSLDGFDVLVVPGGTGARALATDAEALAWLATFPANRLIVSVCTGALVLGAMGRLREKRATTHASAMGELAHYGAYAVSQRVVAEGQTITAGGVTSGIDAGLHVVDRIMGREVARAIAKQMEARVDFLD